MNWGIKGLLPLTLLFLLLMAATALLSGRLNQAGFDTRVLFGSNILFYSISVISYFLQLKGMRNSNSHVFVRSVMGAMMLKMLVCLAATFAYVTMAGDQFSKRAVFLALLLYLVYLAVEVYTVMKMNRKKNA